MLICLIGFWASFVPFKPGCLSSHFTSQRRYDTWLAIPLGPPLRYGLTLTSHHSSSLCHCGWYFCFSDSIVWVDSVDAICHDFSKKKSRQIGSSSKLCTGLTPSATKMSPRSEFGTGFLWSYEYLSPLELFAIKWRNSKKSSG